MSIRKHSGYRIDVGGRTVVSESLAYVASHARAVALTRRTARIFDAEDRAAAVTVATDQQAFCVDFEPPLVLFPSDFCAPTWIQRLETLLAEHG